MLNHIIIGGRLTSDPVVRYTQTQQAVCSVTVACERDYAPQGQQRDVDFIDAVFWKDRAVFAEKYYSKGMLIIVEGRLQKRKWTDNNGVNRESAEIIVDRSYFGEGKKKDANATAVNVTAPAEFEELGDDDGTLPF